MSEFKILELNEFQTWLKGQSVSRLVKLVQNHHTFIPNYTHFKGNNHLDMQKSMERSHIERGFTFIAQHFTTFPDGKIVTGRPLNQIPAGIKGANQFGICIEHVGNFDSNGDTMSEIHKKTIVDMNAILLDRFGLGVSDKTIVYHHWFDLNTGEQVEEGRGVTKSCPGTNFFGGNTKIDFQQNFAPLVESAFIQYKNQNTSSNEDYTTGVVNVAKLNIRMAPNTQGAVLDVLTKGTTVRIFKIVNGWYSIDQSGTRWVKAEYISSENQ